MTEVTRWAIALCLLPGCSLILDFSDPPAPPDAFTIDALGGAACTFDEPNETAAAAVAIDPVMGQDAAICEVGDRDFYAITVADNQTMTFEVVFAQQGTQGDLDEKLLDMGGTTIARSLSTDANEKIVCPGTSPSCPQLAAGTYIVEVFGFADSTVNTYTINYTLQ